MNNTSITCLLCERHCDLREPYCREDMDYSGFYDWFAEMDEKEVFEYAYKMMEEFFYEMPELR